MAVRVAADAQTLRDELRVEFLSGQLAEVVASEYDLGEVVRVEQIFGGFENLSFAVITRDGEGEHRNFVRKYKHGTVEREIRYEHALVRHIRDKGFELPARVFEARSGDTLVTREELLGAERVQRFFAVYEMLTGEDKYTLDREPLHRRGVRGRRPHPGALPPGRPRLRAGRPVPRAAAHHGVPGDHARHVQRLRRQDHGHQVRPLLPRPAAGDPRGDRPRASRSPRPSRDCRGARPSTTTTPATSSGATSTASACSTSTGPSSTTASSTSPSASSTSAPPGRTRTTASSASTRPRSS